MKDRKSKLIFYIGAFGMALFMTADWLLDAAGAGDEELGLIAHTNWRRWQCGGLRLPPHWRWLLFCPFSLLQMKRSK